jgi:hypothetical protein
MSKITIRLSREAETKARNPQQVEQAGRAAFANAEGGDIYCLPFKVNGQQFALSSRTIIEVDWLPNRVP